MSKNRHHLWLTLPFLLLSLAACGEEIETSETSLITTSEEGDPCEGAPLYGGEEIEVSKIVTTPNGTHISVNGEDFLFLGTQIRVDALVNCDHYSLEEIRPLFAEAAALGVTCVQIPVEWTKVEIAKDQYDFHYLHEILKLTNEFDLKVELLWFGSNMCGDTHSYSVPDYILADGRTYPKFDALRTGEYWNYYGIQWFLDFADEDLIAREGKAVREMMDYIYHFDSTHGGKKPVIGIQVENEVDIFPRWRIDQKEVLDPLTGEKMSREVGFQKVYALLNGIGKAVKSAKYKVYTRANLASSTSETGVYSGSTVKTAPDFAKRIQALEGIDIVGDDSYTSSVRNIRGISRMFRESIPNNFSHIAENAGDYGNISSLMLAALSQHGGYSIYDLMTPPFYVANGTSGVNQGILQPGSDRNSFTKASHYAATQSMISALKKVGGEIYKVSPENFMAFNIATDFPKANTTETFSSQSSTLTFETTTGALGFALDFGTHMDVYALDEAYVSLSNGTVTSIEKGSLNGTEFVPEETISYSQKVQIPANTLYRITYQSAGPIDSTTWG